MMKETKISEICYERYFLEDLNPNETFSTTMVTASQTVWQACRDTWSGTVWNSKDSATDLLCYTNSTWHQQTTDLQAGWPEDKRSMKIVPRENNSSNTLQLIVPILVDCINITGSIPVCLCSLWTQFCTWRNKKKISDPEDINQSCLHGTPIPDDVPAWLCKRLSAYKTQEKLNFPLFFLGRGRGDLNQVALSLTNSKPIILMALWVMMQCHTKFNCKKLSSFKDIVWVMMHHHTKFNCKRFSGFEDIIHTKHMVIHDSGGRKVCNKCFI